VSNSPSRDAKAAGLKSLAEAAAMIGRDTDTMTRWHKTSPELFAIVMTGCAETKRQKEQLKRLHMPHDAVL